MEKHSPADEIKKELDTILSKINALEVASSDEYQKNMVKVLRTLTEKQIHSINEFEHLKKAIDLLTLQIFELRDKINS
jgi:hypothetical protein